MQEFDGITGQRSLTKKQAEPRSLGQPGFHSLITTTSLILEDALDDLLCNTAQDLHRVLPTHWGSK